ncbi:polysaccharide pyruvyl transferase family protein [Alteromonas sediminis]|uniref:Polysaccharide pyruvyl transferase family protein n=1 Tax=Alteromonas sediminis TaxID=2259342 RepID=A0A3N5Y5Q2_9ALTE|nr:polysaccharide pyruvyl transferase family protein [Alteromonas sediminis]RPJ68583.1 polysaccharide pyruvyl transferase family protein [Alteromonas sediminis]
MAKISILSFPRYFNFGTFLQLYAMQQTVSALGHDAELIDYDPYNDSGKKGASPLKTFLSRVKQRVLTAESDNFTVDKQSLKKRFQHFLHNELNLGPTTYFSAQELCLSPPNADAVIVGSDQVWNPNGHFKDPAYFLTFVEPQKRIAYAPSFGVSDVPEETNNWLSEHLNGIPNLSVREHAGASIIHRLTGKRVPVVLDPAYLLRADTWRLFAGRKRPVKEKYLFCYFLESDPYMRDTALRIAKDRGLKTVMIPVHKADAKRNKGQFTLIKDAGPKEFVSLIEHADFVCTDSFHGTSFSLILQRQFLTFKRYDNQQQAANHSRIASVLEATGMQSRIADLSNCKSIGQSDICFDKASIALDMMRQGSLEYLTTSIDNALNNNQ